MQSILSAGRWERETELDKKGDRRNLEGALGVGDRTKISPMKFSKN